MLLQEAPIILALFGIWLGFVGAISFMESWLKFRAPGIDVTLGLGIGRLIFKALNRVEWVCLLLILSFHFWTMTSNTILGWSIIAVLASIIVIQTFWLLPLLDSRADLVLKKEPLPASNFHFVYVFLEILKVAILIFAILTPFFF